MEECETCKALKAALRFRIEHSECPRTCGMLGQSLCETHAALALPCPHVSAVQAAKPESIVSEIEKAMLLEAVKPVAMLADICRRLCLAHDASQGAVQAAAKLAEGYDGDRCQIAVAIRALPVPAELAEARNAAQEVVEAAKGLHSVDLPECYKLAQPCGTCPACRFNEAVAKVRT